MKTANPIPIEVNEVTMRDGTHASVITPELTRAGFYCRIRPSVGEVKGGYNRKTKANGTGSIRYDWHPTYNTAVEAGVKWARRKVLELRRGAA